MSLQLSPLVAARELQARRTIRTSLIEWCRLCGFEPAAHHRIIIADLEAVARGECDRLAIFLPPGARRSSRFFDAGALAGPERRLTPNPPIMTGEAASLLNAAASLLNAKDTIAG